MKYNKKNAVIQQGAITKPNENVYFTFCENCENDQMNVFGY